ncbi:Ig-like domain-containing protein [Limnochorda pilosa]|nr:hypothetical protein [Limnochorda pilosa]
MPSATAPIHRRGLRASRLGAACLALLFLLPLPVLAQEETLPVIQVRRPGEGPLVAIFPLQVLNQQVGTSETAVKDQRDLELLSQALSDALAARLVQSGQFRPVTGVRLERRLQEANVPPPPGSEASVEAMRTWLQEAAEALLSRAQVEEAVVGRVLAVQGGLVAVIERYRLADGSRAGSPARLVGSAVAQADKPPALLGCADDLLREVYPPGTEVVPRKVAKLVVLPSALRLPIGQSQRLNVLAFDEDGTLLPNVTLAFQSDDEGRVAVTSDGLVTGLSPGQATVQVQALGRPSTADTASVNVAVLAPNLGFRAGANLSEVAAQRETAAAFGLRLTPSITLQTTSQKVDLSKGLENPLSFLTGFFSSLLGSGLVTLDMDVHPNQDFTVMLDAMQRSRGGYFGTGIGIVTPLKEGMETGLGLRLTLGTQFDWLRGSRFAVPFELNADLVFRGGVESSTEARVVLVTGIDLFP